MLNIKKLYPTTLKTGLSHYQRYANVITHKDNHPTYSRYNSKNNFYNQQLIGGQHMRIKFKRVENFQTKPNASGKTYPMVRVVGEALQGSMIGQEWSTKFFPSSKDMHSVVKSANVDDIIEITMKKNGTFLNPVSMEIIAGDVVAVDNKVATQINQPTDMSPLRRKNLAVAVSVLGPKKAKDDTIEYLMDAAGIADLVSDYAKEKGAFKFDKETTGTGIPDADDAPTPEAPPKPGPDVEEIPF